MLLFQIPNGVTVTDMVSRGGLELHYICGADLAKGAKEKGGGTGLFLPICDVPRHILNAPLHRDALSWQRAKPLKRSKR